MSNLQYINDSNGKPLFVILPIEQFEEMELLSRFAIESEEEQAQWEAIQVEANEADEQGDTIPNEIVNIMIDEDVSLLGAWRIYRKLSQYDVAKQTGLILGLFCSQMGKRYSLGVYPFHGVAGARFSAVF